MKSLIILVFFVSSAAWAQAPQPLTPETVVAHINEKPVTAGELMTVLQLSPPEMRKSFSDGKAFLEQLGYVQKLAALAEKAHLDQQSPAKETLQFQRMYTMASAELQAAQDAIPVSGEDQKKYYEGHKDQYSQAKVKLLYISFRSNPEPPADPKAKKYLSESEARTKIEKLLSEIRGGADFVKLVKQNSDDSASVARDGDFETPIQRSDKWPEDIKSVIFALKPGQVSEPVRTPAGFYLFRLEDLTVQSYDQVRDTVFLSIRQERFQKWMDDMKKAVDIRIDNPDFFNKTMASAGTK